MLSISACTLGRNRRFSHRLEHARIGNDHINIGGLRTVALRPRMVTAATVSTSMRSRNSTGRCILAGILRKDCWAPVEKANGKRALTLRVTLPTRTKTHNQAAVHTVWTPGSPTVPDQEAIRLYGFRKIEDHWQCTATAGRESPYETDESGN